MQFMLNLFRRLGYSFQVRLFLALTLVIIFIPGTGYLSYLHTRKAVEQQIQHYATSMVNQIAEKIRLFLNQHTTSVLLIKSVLESRVVNVDRADDLIRYFYLLKRDHPEFVNIYYGNEEGEFTMVPPQFPEIHKIFDPRSRPWYSGAVASRGLFWTRVYLFASAQKPGITVSVPVFAPALHARQVLQGVCAIDIDLSTFSRFLQSIMVENQGVAYIIENQEGRVIAHPELAQLSLNPQDIELLSVCLIQLKTAGKSFGLTTFQGQDFFTAFTNYAENDWTVGITVPLTDFLKHVAAIQRTTAGLVVVAMVLAFMLSCLVTLMIVNPLKLLRQGIERISRGDLDYKMNPFQLDIADALADSFNRMAASLQKSQEQLKRTCIELAGKEKMAALGQMTAGIAHELRNPLGVILGSAQVVANTKRPLAMREQAARFIIDEIERLNKTINDFLAFAKPASPCFVETDILQLLEETLAVIESQLDGRGIEVEKAFMAEPGFCNTDRDQIRQVFWNILLNAEQAMPKGGLLRIAADYRFRPEAELREAALDCPVCTSGKSRELVITFSDTGPGIPPEQLERIFEPFVSYREGGVGLGLSIVYQVLKLHRAEIRVLSEVGRGTSFILVFPCSRDQETNEVQNTAC